MKTHSRVTLLFALGASIVLAGCGIKSRPIPPQFARPERIADLNAASVQGGIRLSWGRPERYTSGARMRDLGKFEIMRSDDSGAIRQIAEIPVTDLQRFRQQRHFAYVDSDTEIGKRYRYQVVSITTDGYESQPSAAAEIVRAVPKPPPNPETYVLPTPVPPP